MNKVIIVSDAIQNEQFVTFLLKNGFKVAGWDLLENRFWDTPAGLAYLTIVQQHLNNVKLFWCDSTDKGGAELGLRITENSLGKPELIVLPIKEYKKLIGL